jgi:cathepsin L
MKLVFVLFAAVLCINAFTTEDSFQLWMQKHNKNYQDAEYAYRLGVYRQNVQFIEEHNRLNKGFTVAINKFADLTSTEFASIYNGLRTTSLRKVGNAHAINPMFTAPDTVDWRTKGVVTAVKDQGQCGSCWAFSTTGSVEGAWAVKFGAAKLTSISEQNLVDCSGSYGNYGCDGGLMDNAFQYIIANKGIDTEKSYPYTAQDGDCSFSASNVGSTISSFKDVTSGDEASLTDAIANIGPISIGIDASQSSFQFYSGGVYYESACSSSQLDHGVLAVGYGTQSGSDFYTVKNSWGADWGSNGYILMSRNKDNNCGIATAASYPIV